MAVQLYIVNLCQNSALVKSPTHQCSVEILNKYCCALAGQTVGVEYFNMTYFLNSKYMTVIGKNCGKVAEDFGQVMARCPVQPETILVSQQRWS